MNKSRITLLASAIIALTYPAASRDVAPIEIDPSATIDNSATNTNTIEDINLPIETIVKGNND